MKFEYTPIEMKIEAYGREYDLPKRTVETVEKIQACQAALNGESTPTEQAQALLDYHTYIFGSDFVSEHFPDIKTADTDELSALWMATVQVYAEATNALTQQYSANRAARLTNGR